MPDRGLLEAAAVGDAVFDADAELVLPDARWLQVTFEVARDAALSMMPPEAGKPVPPYGRLVVAVSAAGSLALLSVGGRYRMLPRNVLVAAVQNGADVAGTFGAAAAGSVTLEKNGAAVSATVHSEDGLLAAVTLPSVYAIEPTMLRWDAFIAMGRMDGVAQIAEVTPAHELSTAFLSKDANLEMSRALPRDHAWRRLQPLNVISACYAEGALRMGGAVIQQTW